MMEAAQLRLVATGCAAVEQGVFGRRQAACEIRGHSNSAGFGAVMNNVVEFPGAEPAEIEWTQSMIDEVHGRAFRDLEKSICSRCSMSRTC
jgi:hypothetical protein